MRRVTLYLIHPEQAVSLITFEVVLQRNVEVEAVGAVGEPESEVCAVDGDDEVPGAVADGLDGGPGVGGDGALGNRNHTWRPRRHCSLRTHRLYYGR